MAGVPGLSVSGQGGLEMRDLSRAARTRMSVHILQCKPETLQLRRDISARIASVRLTVIASSAMDS